MLVPGLAMWLWSVILILANVPRGRLITGGPYGWVKHPLYAAAALLVLPWAGFLLDTWLGAAIGAVLYLASRISRRLRKPSCHEHSAQRGRPIAVVKLWSMLRVPLRARRTDIPPGVSAAELILPARPAGRGADLEPAATPDHRRCHRRGDRRRAPSTSFRRGWRRA